ncbi:MAG: methyltransferase [Thermocrispum sp.]
MSESVWELADLITPMAVRVAATLRVADHITAGRRTAREIAAAADAHPDALERVMRHLVTVGVLTGDGRGGFGLTELGEQLTDDHPAGMRQWIDLTGAVGRADECLVDLLHTVRTGEPAFPHRFGASFWDDLAADPARSAGFDALMGHHTASDSGGVADAYDWGSLGSVVDVGGGNGALLCSLLARHAALRGTVLDLPAPAAAARKALRDNGFADRADALEGSFFDAVPSGAGGYLLSFVIHDWNDDDARAILRRCAQAIGDDGAAGAVFLIEGIGDDGDSPSTEMDLRMLAYANGKERTLGEYAALAGDVGLAVARVHPAGDASVIELRPERRQPR